MATQIQARGNCGSVVQNLCLTECAEPRSENLLSQARCILANRLNCVQYFFTQPLTVDVIEERGEVKNSISGNSTILILYVNWMDV